MTQSLRIVHCFRSPVGGIFRHVRDLAEAQAEAGHEVGVVCDSTTGGDYEDRLFEQIAPVLALGVKRTPPSTGAASQRETRRGTARRCSDCSCDGSSVA